MSQKYSLLDPTFQYSPTPNTSGRRSKTELVVLHYSASGTLPGTVTWLCDPQAKASAHFVVDRDGTTAQLASLDAVTWHAGQSSWRGEKVVNGRSLGIELINYGALLIKPSGEYVSAAGSKPVHADDVFHGKHPTDVRCPYIYWQKYPEAQLSRVREIVAELRKRYPSIQEVIGHQDCAPSRKIDPGPALPADTLSYRIGGTS